MGAVPRWEYRIWQEAPPPLPCDGIEERTDLYLIRPGMTARLVKLRDAMFEVKTLIDESDGLQLWQPAPGRSFPLEAGPVAAALCLDEPERAYLGHRLDSATTLLSRLARGTSTRLVRVGKRRIKQDCHGCIGETAQVEIGGTWYGSRALEDEDPEHVLAAIAALGWPHGRNESYVARLTRAPERLQPAITSSSQCSP